ncbi:MAG: hypothetical protein HYU66_12780 [Armatimonadetes bacterium]|nr:hypothetical protein [Armatimonadota bacterium]
MVVPGAHARPGAPQRRDPARPARSFLALTLDPDRHAGGIRLGRLDSPPQPVAAWTDLPVHDPGDGVLELANFLGIRPFKGDLDTVRLYAAALDDEAIHALWDEQRRAVRTLAERVAPHDLPLGLQHSDVFFSSRWGRPNALEAVKAFGANRVVWVYTSDAAWVKSMHDAGASVEGAINSIPRVKDLSAYTVDLDGTKLVAPWMVDFDRKDPVKWGCCNQPAFCEAVLAQAKATLGAGADWLQYDDGALNVSAHEWGGCFCDRCMAAFREYLAGLPAEQVKRAGIESLDGFDYRQWLAAHDVKDAATYKQRRRTLPTEPLFEDWLRRTVRSYFATLRQQLDQLAGRRVPLSLNANLQNPSAAFLADQADLLIGETWSEALEDVAVCSAAAEALVRPQVTSPYPFHVQDTRLALAATYATGLFFLVPWDVWMGAGTKERYFGTVQEYGDLYRFVREHAALLDGFATPAVVGLLVDLDHYDAVRVRRAAIRLLKARVPFALLPVGHRYVQAELDAKRLARLDLVIVACDAAVLAEADRAVLSTAAVLVAGDGDPLAVDLTPLAPVEVWGPPGVRALPRVKPGGRTLAIHVLNRNQREPHGPVAPLKYVSVGLRPAAQLGPKVARAVWHAVGAEPVAVEPEELPGLLRLVLPEVREWGILEVEFTAPG